MLASALMSAAEHRTSEPALTRLRPASPKRDRGGAPNVWTARADPHRAGSLQGLLPGAPTDPGVHVKRTRFGTLSTIAVPHTTGSFRADTLVRHGVLGVVPTPRPQRGALFARWGRGGPFPRFITTMGRCDSLPSISPPAGRLPPRRFFLLDSPSRIADSERCCKYAAADSLASHSWEV